MKSKLFLTFVALAFLMPSNSKGQSDVNNAEAMFIYNFLSHVQWPANNVNGKYVIGVYGNSPTYDYLKTYTKGRKVGVNSIEVIKIYNSNEVKNCNVLLVSREKSADIQKMNELSKGCLIIGEKPGTTNYGAVVDFHITNNKLRYKINEENAKNQNLIVSRALMTMSL